jgi:signal transduction histidine kinase
MMPVMDGYQVLEHLQADALLTHIPVVVISAAGDLDSVTRCIELGAEDYLFKPFNPVLLHARIKACLAKKRLHDQERAAASALQAANQLKIEFVSLVSHELKNPLTGIKGYVDMMLLSVFGPLLPAQIEGLQSIQGLTEVMITLLGDLGDISQIEAGYLHLERTSVQLRAALDAALQALGSRIAAKGQRLALALPTDLPDVAADRTRLVQILSNLISNACKYTPEGGQITVSATLRASALVEVVVSDTGIGMSEDDQRRVFERFFRAADDKVRKESGTGLGLNITRHLIEIHGGQIGFESAVGRGTRFFFTIPTADTLRQPVSASYEPRA